MSADIHVLDTGHVPPAANRQELADWLRVIANAIEKGERMYETLETAVIVLVPNQDDLFVRANGPDTNDSYRLMGYLQGALQQMWDDMKNR
jgi:hypothetical protein